MNNRVVGGRVVVEHIAGVPRTRVVQLGVWTLILAFLGWVIGLSVANAVLLAGVVVVVYSLRHLPFGESPHWADRSDERTDQGARRDVARLSWNMQGYGHRVDRMSVKRLRAIATRRLAEDGLQLSEQADAEACRARLGPKAYVVLTTPDATARPLLTDFLATIAAVEALR